MCVLQITFSSGCASVAKQGDDPVQTAHRPDSPLRRENFLRRLA